VITLGAGADTVVMPVATFSKSAIS
jgi:hypothetical protein